MTVSDLCSGWQQGCPSQMGTAEDLGDQATSLQFWHLVVGGRFLPFTLRNVENHSSSVWRGIRGWLTWSSYVQMLRNNFPPTLARTGLRTISQHTIRHPKPKILHMLRRPLMGFWCHSVRRNQGKIKFTLSYAALQLLWKAALNIPEFLASLQNVFLMGQKNISPLCHAVFPSRHDAEPAGPFPLQMAGVRPGLPLFLFWKREDPSSCAFIKPCACTMSAKWHFWII